MNHPLVTITLEDNRQIKIELYPESAPLTVENFISLVKSGYYNGVVFHRVIKEFMIQTGGYYLDNNEIKPKPKVKSIPGEFKSNGHPNDLHHELGVISMARTMDKNSASSQFFLCIDNCYHLNGEYAGFGKAVDEDSKRLIQELGQVSTHSLSQFADFPVKPITIKTIVVE